MGGEAPARARERGVVLETSHGRRLVASVAPGEVRVAPGLPPGTAPVPAPGVAFAGSGGAPFEHLDAFENVAVAFRARAPERRPPADDVVAVMVEAGLDPAWATRAREPKQTLSGQLPLADAVRLALARALAAGARVLVLAAPREGALPGDDAERLAADVRAAARRAGLAVLWLEHPDGVAPAADARAVVRDADPAPEDPATPRRVPRIAWPLAVLWRAPGAAIGALARRPDDLVDVAVPTFRRALVRPLPLFAAVGLGSGVALYLAFARLHPTLPAAAAVRVVGGAPLLALAPPLTAWLFAWVVGAPVARWLAGMRARGEVAALESLGASRTRSLWGPAWLALALSALVAAAVLGTAMLVGALAVAWAVGAPEPLATLTREAFDPVAGVAGLRVRALLLLLGYAGALASATVARGEGDAPRLPAGAGFAAGIVLVEATTWAFLVAARG